ncbi:MAG: hypothetical protein A3F78_08690 [Burkholderiales bacterium RIFCSPLOWO2_12_FULL_61_40]|nr:MAG: hypothetical protein A3F78_08690 [Burkholderiales bacterium RIFCSPLOWO2_12_FULL_61_40]
MNWFDRHPEDLAEQSEPAEALAALRALDALTPAQIAAMDVYLNHWVLVVLLRPNDREGLLEVQQLCGLARVLTGNAAETEAFRIRWKAFGDLLEGKRNALQVNAVEAPFKLLHEDAILMHASHPECRQSDLVTELKLSAGRVSQLLGTLEAQGKIVRQRKGKESWVSLPVAGKDAEKAAPTKDHIGSTFFRRLKAA